MKVTAKRNGPGRKILTAGSGSTAATAGAWFNDVDGGWQVDTDHPSADHVNPNGPFKTLASLKDCWGKWAEREAEGEPHPDRVVPSTAAAPPPMPPSFKRPKPEPPASPPPRSACPPPPFKRTSRPEPAPASGPGHVPTPRLLELAEYAQEKFNAEAPDFRDAHVSLATTIERVVKFARRIEAEGRAAARDADPDADTPAAIDSALGSGAGQNEGG
jgi:hypothetical protein